MRISIEAHTLLRAAERGATEVEIMEVLNTGTTMPAKNSRSIRYKVFPFGKERNGKFYEQKKVDVVFIEEEETIVNDNCVCLLRENGLTYDDTLQHQNRFIVSPLR